MAAAVAKHETRALLRAHLAAATGYRHRTRHCPICHRLLLLALQPERTPQGPPQRLLEDPRGRTEVRRAEGRTDAAAGPPPARDESPPDP
ncbi:DUF6274 family protein [Streptomyces sp. NPDC091272]|uniref:DUF6274 family protein n=1 Tax=Streptomyces sp. NPDC091272 TaxID=3365981 RepID=UPI00381A3231